MHVSGRTLCSAACARTAQSSFLSAWSRAQLSAFAARCAETQQTLPLLAARLACRVAQGAASSAALEPLCFAANAVRHPPPAWLEEHALLLDAFVRGGLPSRFLTPAWYVSVVARLHLNAFRVEPLRFDVTDLNTLAAQSLTGSGSAVYLLPSLVNHDCEPNLDASWPEGDATLVLSARRDIAAGEALSITYIDSGLGVTERQAQLHYGYGFNCACETCREELAGAPR